jgi:hypothetical protein
MFEVFRDTGTRAQEFISITETKSFGLSRAFLDEYKITSNHKAVILYDSDTNRIALHFSTNAPKFALTLRIANPKHGGNIIAKSFFETKDVDAKRYSGRYTDFQRATLASLGVKEEGMAFVIQLHEREESAARGGKHNEPDLELDSPINLDEIPF